ncbi:hypothetical protein MRQ36_27220 [Micromonospora sp. R77]|uniref:hypothetical protein n=1 Tax=Micromonospora sp. R77 TaxID=2925836 RepID=UPI001F6009BB|nr:hypothetical protein [Micromonospora sp. R77]MCI4066041.1 hypothetical protein [Micromonospora sp. R77]
MESLGDHQTRPLRSVVDRDERVAGDLVSVDLVEVLGEARMLPVEREHRWCCQANKNLHLTDTDFHPAVPQVIHQTIMPQNADRAAGSRPGAAALPAGGACP